MSLTGTLLVTGFGAVLAAQAARILVSSRFFRDHAAREVQPPSAGPPMVLLIPVLYEQRIILETIARFSRLIDGRPWLTVLFVTSAKETAPDEGPTTHALIEAHLPSHPRLRFMRYPGIDGVMAHQLNHAVSTLRAGTVGQLFIAVYNADSSPDPRGIDWAYERLCEDPRSVLQQYAWYRPPARAGGVLGHIAVWQTRWSLQFELGRLLIDRQLIPEPTGLPRWWDWLRPFHYAIGHGLFLSHATWHELTGFPEDELNEDAFFGFLLHLKGIRIEPVPFLEAADAPPSVSVYLRQQTVWFNGPMFAWRYGLKSILGSAGPHRDRPVACGWAARAQAAAAVVKLGSHAVFWLAGPPTLLVVVPALLLALGDHAAFGAFIVELLIFVYGLQVLAARALRAVEPEAEGGGSVAEAFVAYALHCVGPTLAIARTLGARNDYRHKYKTERA